MFPKLLLFLQKTEVANVHIISWLLYIKTLLSYATNLCKHGMYHYIYIYTLNVIFLYNKLCTRKIMYVKAGQVMAFEDVSITC